MTPSHKQPPSPAAIVIFGANGDLTKRLIVPALYNLSRTGMLPAHFALNANLTLNLGGSNQKQLLFVKEITLLAVTPRWETKNLGAYLPVTVTTDGKVWLGGAFKAGPLLLGIHNWANLVTKDKMANGGFYLALVVRQGKGWSIKEAKKYTCPVN